MVMTFALIISGVSMGIQLLPQLSMLQLQWVYTSTKPNGAGSELIKSLLSPEQDSTVILPMAISVVSTYRTTLLSWDK